MIDSDNPPKLIKTEDGYYTYETVPGVDELHAYYESRYYQEERSTYSKSYTDEEVDYFRLQASLLCMKVGDLLGNTEGIRAVDIGCGEGWTLAALQSAGYDVWGIDYSDEGLARWHPDLLDRFEKSDIERFAEESRRQGRLFDVIVLANVIEHVPDPKCVLQSLLKILSSSGILVIVAPNDFSSLHDYLERSGRINQPFWLSYPDHLSYFNKQSMENLLAHVGYEVRAVVADNPIDMNLLNDNSNYIADPSLGKSSHMFRVRSDLFLAGIDIRKMMALYESYGAMGVGRDLSYYCSVSE